jgi:succinyl-diaminopimelate desuccinylase
VSEKAALLATIEQDRNEIIDFFQGLVRVKTPNPPGDTREAAAYIGKFLTAEGLPFRIVAPMEEYPNLIASFDASQPGRHLVLNGHIDVFPVDPTGWTQDPWGGALVDGKIYGRGACDMKAGTTASIFTYRYLHRIRDKLKGKLTLTCVSDEETFGPWGARYLMEHCPEVHGDCLLNGEPSGTNTIRFGEKGPLWLAFTVTTPGAHGAYTHLSASATKIAGRLIADLETLTEIPATPPDNAVRALEQAAPAVDQAMGAGASLIVPKVTLNVGVMTGGLKVNMVPGQCRIEADIRLPLGIDKERSSHAILGSWRRRSTSTPHPIAIRTARWSRSCKPTPGSFPGWSRCRSSAWAEPTPVSGAIATFRLTCTVRRRPVWAPATSM